jgi:hypothetical protein
LRELRAALRGLRSLPGLDPKRLALWGDSLAQASNPAGEVGAPLELPQPPHAEPLGGVLALLAGLFEEGVVSIRAHGGLAGYASLLGSSFCHVPYDGVVPGALRAGDVGDVVAALAPLPVRLTGLVDGSNRRVGAKAAERLMAPAADAYRLVNAAEKLRIED